MLLGIARVSIHDERRGRNGATLIEFNGEPDNRSSGSNRPRRLYDARSKIGHIIEWLADIIP